MSIFSSVKIGAATNDYNKFDLSNNHLTTTDFAQHNILRVDMVYPGDKFHVDINHLTRTAPVVFPTYASIGQRLIYAFVPFYQLADDAEAFLSGITSYAGSVATGRFMYQTDIDTLFYGSIYQVTNPSLNSTYLQYIAANSDEHKYLSDLVASGENLPLMYFQIKRSGGAVQYYTFTYQGKYLYKLLRQLGYTVSQFVDFTQSSSADYTANGRTVLNAYPLLAYFKMYADLMLPTAYYQTSPLLQYLHDVKSKSNNAVDSNGFINISNVHHILSYLTKVFYDSDYFTSAWQSPNSPLSTALTSVTDYSDGNNRVNLEADEISNKVQILGGQLSATQLNFLRSFDNFIRRNNLVGFREFNAVYARFGIKPSEMRSNYTQLIDIRNFDMQVGDVTATAQTDDTLLGSYAGKAFIKGGSNIDFESKDYGILICVGSIYVKPMYFQGVRKHCLLKDAFDYYQPEFDGVGPSAIGQIELNASVKNTVFGFTERYNECRFALDNITGEFATDPQMFPWHAGREFDYKSAPVAQSDGFLRYGVDRYGNSEYSRIFSTQNRERPFDHFYQVWNFKVSALRKMKNINAAQNLGFGDIQLDRNGSV